MKVFATQEDLKSYLSDLGDKSIGFVPTMGALHQGHLSLIKKSRSENDLTVCSIFVNPTQFNNPDDLSSYPVLHEQDIKLLEQENCDLLYLPDNAEDVYLNEQSFEVDLGMLEDLMEGEHRPGHFNGVMRVVKLLLEIVSPDRAYFGLKDYQQYLVVKTMVDQLKLGVDIVGCEIIREPSGLAMSSRNMLLSEQETVDALILQEALLYCKEHIQTESPEQIKEHCLNLLKLKSVPEYFEILDKSTLQPAKKGKKMENIHAFTAAVVGNVRLIDNLEIC